jgi:DNA anti-recombination protein RmuC
LELNLPPGSDVHAQIERVIDELMQRLGREHHGEQRPRPQHDDNGDRGRPNEPDSRRHHLANAIEHLQAAGLHDEAHQLRERFDDLLSRPAREHAEHREEEAPPHDAHRGAPSELLREIEDRMHHFERAVDEIRHESGRRFEELERAFREHIQRLEREVSERSEGLERAFREHIQRLEREMSERFEDLTRHIAESRRE